MRQENGQFARGLIYGVGVDDVAYTGIVRVHGVWHKYSAFKEWYGKHSISGYVLDKDILGGTLYGPDTCIFIPEELNLAILRIRRKSTGVWYDSDRNKFQAYITYKGTRKHLGRYETFVDAKNAHLKARYEILCKYAEEFPSVAWAVKRLCEEIVVGLKYVEE